MPCRHVKIPGTDTWAVVCGRSERPRPCKYCGRPHEKLCDYPLTGAKAGKTCDIPMCAKCAFHVPPDTDYCPAHRDLYLKVLDAKVGDL